MDTVTIWIKQLIKDNQVHDFYISPQWQQLRATALKQQNYECQRCKLKKLVVPATTVHHVQELRRRPDLALDISNLQVLCTACHYDMHHRGSKDGFNNEERW